MNAIKSSLGQALSYRVPRDMHSEDEDIAPGFQIPAEEEEAAKKAYNPVSYKMTAPSVSDKKPAFLSREGSSFSTKKISRDNSNKEGSRFFIRKSSRENSKISRNGSKNFESGSLKSLLSAEEPEPDLIRWSQEKRGMACGIISQENKVITDQDEYDVLWFAMYGLDNKKLRIDFTSEQLIGVFLGNQSAGCEVTITKVREDEDGIIVYYRMKMPSPKEPVKQEKTQPFHIVVVPKLNRAVFFQQQGRVDQRKYDF